MVANGQTFKPMSMNVKLVGLDLDKIPIAIRTFRVSADSLTTVSRASRSNAREEYTSLEYQQRWRQERAHEFVTRLVLTTLRRKHLMPAVRPPAENLYLQRRKPDRPPLIAQGWDGHRKSRSLLEPKLMKDLRGHSGTWAKH